MLRVSLLAAALILAGAPPRAAAAPPAAAANTLPAPQERTPTHACALYLRRPDAPRYDKRDNQGPAVAANLHAIGPPANPQRSFVAPAAACDAVRRRDSSVFVETTVWFRADDLVTDDALEPITRWTTRYQFVLANPIEFGPVQYSRQWGPTERWLENSRREIGLYQAEHVSGLVRLFTPDGRLIDTRHGIAWRLHRSPTGLLVLRDPDGKVLPTTLAAPRCTRDGAGALACGLADETSATEAYYPGDEGERVIRVEPGRIVITRRTQVIERPRDTLPLTVTARFTDPVRPLVFAPGVLFAPGARPNPKGRYRPADLLMREQCVADCPQQLRLQGLAP